MPISFPGVFLHRSIFATRGVFDESFQIAGDYEFLLRELIDRPPLFLDDLVTLMSPGGKSSSRENRLVRSLEDARARKLNGLFPYPAAWCWEFIKDCLYRVLDNTFGTRAALFVQQAYKRLVGASYRIWRALSGRPSGAHAQCCRLKRPGLAGDDSKER